MPSCRVPFGVPRVLERLTPEQPRRLDPKLFWDARLNPPSSSPAFVFLAAPAEAAFVNGTTLEVTGARLAPARAEVIGTA